MDKDALNALAETIESHCRKAMEPTDCGWIIPPDQSVPHLVNALSAVAAALRAIASMKEGWE